MIDCDKFKGRLKDICLGKTILPLAMVNKYRSAWGLEPLTELPENTKPISSRPMSSHPQNTDTPNVRTTGGCGGCGKKSEPLPSLLTQAVNFGKAVAKHVVNPTLLPAPEVEARLTICESCEWFRAEDRRCAHVGCGCFLDQKATWASEDCPIGKWPKPNTVGNKSTMNWAYGITTVPGRAGELFPRTLKSLARSGFDKPRLFIDRAKDGRDYEQYGLEITTHWPNLRTAGNWVLSLYELYIRDPHADRYAIFQDDFVTSLNLKQYLERCSYPEQGYWNLYTFPINQSLCPENRTYQGWYTSDQYGKGAVALVFDREAVCTLLSQRKLVDRPQDKKRGHKAIDGGIADAFKKIGWKEYVHSPSLVQHTGLLSSMGNPKHPLATSFQGEEFDLMTIVPNRGTIGSNLNEWERELASLEKAMAEDQARLAAAQKEGKSRETEHFRKLVKRYQSRIRQHLTKKS